MSKMEEEGAEKWTEEQLAETMMEFSGIPHLCLEITSRQDAHGWVEGDEIGSYSSDTVG